MKGKQMSIRLKKVEWADHPNFSSAYILTDRYEVRIIEGYGWCANHMVDNPFVTLSEAKAACEQHALERIMEAVEVEPDHFRDATKMIDPPKEVEQWES